ncbi:MAG: CsgG/HfaB family protein [Candidatus Poribacteria bacterium]
MLGFGVALYRMDIASKIIALIVGVSLSILGCGGKSPKGYLKPGVTASQIRYIAVLPFDNISGHPDAGRKAVNLLLTELARTGLFEIAGVGEVEKSLRRLRIRTTAEVDLSKLKSLGEQLNVQAIVVGSVDEYEVRQEKSITIPIVAISARMLNVQTGDILWTISDTHDGRDWETVFGFGRIISLTELAQIVISEMVDSLVHELKKSSKAEMGRSQK